MPYYGVLMIKRMKRRDVVQQEDHHGLLQARISSRWRDLYRLGPITDIRCQMRLARPGMGR
jgi:hypothetical protein